MMFSCFYSNLLSVLIVTYNNYPSRFLYFKCEQLQNKLNHFYNTTKIKYINPFLMLRQDGIAEFEEHLLLERANIR